MTYTYAQASTALTNTQIRDTILLPGFAAAGSTVGGAPSSSPDRAIVEETAAFLAMEQGLRVGIALSISAATALQAGDSWVDASATWYQVPSNAAPLVNAGGTGITMPNGAPGGTGRFQATYALWTVQLTAAPAALPMTLNPGQTVQIQATDALRSVFSMTITSPVTISSGVFPAVTFVALVPGIVAGGGGVTSGQLQGGKVIAGPAGLSIYSGGSATLAQAAQDTETSAALVVRCFGRWGTLGPGNTLPAYDYLIPSLAPDLTGWYVDDSNPFGPGSVGIWLRTAAGAASGPVSTPGTDCALVYAGLTAPGARRLGSGPLVVQPAGVVALAITMTIATDGSNTTLAADAQAAISSLSSAIMGPALLTADLVLAVLRGGSFVGTFEIPSASTSPSVTRITLNLPGFGGVVGFAVFTSSPSFPPITEGGLVLTSGQIFDITLDLTVVTL